jgi:hypothetical protein
MLINKLIFIALASSVVHYAAAQNIFQAPNTGNAVAAVAPSSSSTAVIPDEPCIQFCANYFDLCEPYNYFLYQPSSTGSKASKNRKLGESNQPRTPQTSDISECLILLYVVCVFELSSHMPMPHIILQPLLRSRPAAKHACLGLEPKTQLSIPGSPQKDTQLTPSAIWVVISLHAV